MATVILIPGLTGATNAIDINTATLAQLDELSGIGPAYAQNIINARPFSSVDELVRVKGIGEKTLAKIKAQGFACVNCQTTEAAQTSAGPPQNSAPPEQTMPAENSSTAQNQTLAAYAKDVVINEVMPSPDGPDETNEWIELYNSGSLTVDMSGWKLRDTQGTVATYSFGAGASILAGNYIVMRRPETNIILNDDQDKIELVWPDGNVADAVAYEKAPRNQSYSNRGGVWAWNTAPTPGAANSAPVASASLADTLPKPKKSATNQTTQTAAVALSVDPENTKSADKKEAGAMSTQFIFLGAGVLLMICGAGILGYHYFRYIKYFKNHERP